VVAKHGSPKLKHDLQQQQQQDVAGGASEKTKHDRIQSMYGEPVVQT